MQQKERSEAAVPLRIFTKLGLFVRSAFYTRPDCLTVRSEMRRATQLRATLSGISADAVDESVRSTNHVYVSEEAESSVKGRFASLMPVLSEHFQVELSRVQDPQFLIYDKGDYFAKHFDGHPERAKSSYARERKVSAVVFLNERSERSESYQGGDLVLYGLMDGPVWRNVGMPFPVSEGTLVAFRSDLWHEVRPVAEGRRYSVVTWFE